LYAGFLGNLANHPVFQGRPLVFPDYGIGYTTSNAWIYHRFYWFVRANTLESSIFSDAFFGEKCQERFHHSANTKAKKATKNNETNYFSIAVHHNKYDALLKNILKKI
jgi:hypothetical protein